MTLSDNVDSVAEFKSQARRQKLKLGFIVIGAVALFGLLPMALDMGYFGWKLARFERVTLTMVNTTGDDLIVALGTSSIDCRAHEVCSVEFRAGQVTLSIQDSGGRVIDERDFFTDNQSVFYNYEGARCYAVVDASNLYAGSEDAEALVIADRIYRDDRIHLINGGIFVPPGGILPQTVPGGNRVVWIDRAGCQLLDESNEHLLIGQLIVRMEGRRERREEEMMRRQNAAQTQ